MIVLDILSAVGAGLCCFAYICRFGSLVAWKHKPVICAMHVALGLMAFDAGVKALHGETDLQAVAQLVAAGGWILVSRENWANGVPAHYARQRLRVVQTPERVPVRAKS